jgi:cyclin-dependent kinase 8/11
MGSKHYTSAVDMWAVGTIFAELLILSPIFKGEEIKPTATINPSTIDVNGKFMFPFQRNQVEKIIHILGTPTVERWPDLVHCPDFEHLHQFPVYPSLYFLIYNFL